jgi:predicted RNase H-like HicB family nuclease
VVFLLKILIENLPNVYSAVRNTLIQSGATTEELFPPLEEEIVTEQDPTLMFTNRGNNYFVSSEGDEYFQLAESEDIDFEFNGQYTREQLENTGLETINSGTYQSLLDDLSFHALEEDIYQYSMEDLVARYEEEGGILPGDWKLMDEESRYNYFLDDYFDIPRTIEDPDKDDLPGEVEPPVEPPPTDQPEPEPEPPTEEPEPEPTPTDIESLFADFLAQIDEEFTGQIEQVNQIIQNFVETLPDFDAMPTMEDIAEYFEINGVTLSQQNFDRIRQELADAGYLTQEQLTEALAGVATPEQVQEAIQNAGFATPEQVMQALAEAGYATPEDITNALANSGFVTENRLLQALAEAGYATPDQVEQIVNNAISNIVIPEGATAEEVRQLIQEAIDGIPVGISLDDVSGVVNEAIANIEFPEGLSDSDVRNIVGSFGFATTEEVRGIINEAIAGIVIPEGATTEEVRQLIQEAIDGIPEGISLDEVGGLINEAIANIDFPEGLSGDDVRSIVDSFGFATTENVRDIVNTAISNIQFPEGATTEEVRQLIQEALDGLPEGISLEDIGGIVNEAIANIEFPEGLSEGDVRGIVDSFGFATSADVQAGFDDLNDKIDNVLNGVATQFTEQEAAFAADLLGLETSVFQQLAATEGALRDELLGLGEDLDSIRADFSGRFDEFADTFAAFQTDVSGQFDTLNNKIDDAVNGLSIQLTEQEATFLEELTGVEASVLQQLAATEGGLRSELESLGFNLTEFQSDVAGRFDQFEDTFALFQTDVGEQFADLNQRFDDAVNGIATQFSNQEAEFLASITGLEASFIQSLAAVEGGLSGELEMLGTDLISLQEDVAGRFDEFQETFTGFQANVTGQFGDLNDKLDDALNGIATQFSDQEAAFLETVTGVEASVLQQLATVEGGLSNQLQALGFNLASLQADVFGRFDEFEQTVGQQLTQAEQDRSRIEQSLQNALALQAQGQLRALTEAEARLLAEITGGNAEILQELSTQTGGLQQQLSDLGFNITDVESRLGEQITTGLSQAQQDRLRIEQGLYNALQLQSQGQAVELDEAEARLLAEITGGDATILQEMSSQTGALENQLSSLGLNLTTVQQNLSQDISDLQAFTGFGFSEAAQQRQNLQQALIVANADITQLSSDMFAQFQSQNESIEELFEGTNVNIEALQQGQISQAEAFAQYAQSTDVRLGLGEQQREEILTRQADFERMYGEEQQKLQQQIMGGNVLTALAAGGMFAAPAVPTRAPYEEFMKGITYRPREAPQLAIKTPALDYNEEAQKLLMRTRRRGMLV